ncbi:MAG: sulfatase-like hydrolase/transferase [Candidatus Binatia bacterium]|nr:sulfatase-like hydrolase/transferase [Candidatus Binatia bacterium]
MTERPNVLVLITDQERRGPAYEDDAVAQFRSEHLPARRWLQENGVEFAQHYTGATACSPSRPTLLTGQYPSLHAVTQTSGIAKHHGDARLRWLRPADVPTLGDYFRAAGYDTVYKGKWHVSDADLRDDTGRVVRTSNSAGERIPDGERVYEEANPLGPLGFDGWIGPEPHGAALGDAGVRRDTIFADQATSWLRARSKETADEPRPFLLVASFVNPHDICLWPSFAIRPPIPLTGPTVPHIEAPPSAGEDLSTKPQAQQRYREAYLRMYGPEQMMRKVYQNHLSAYRKFYYHLHQLVDLEIDRVLTALREGPFLDNTVVVFTSDHGELLGAHGGLHQKWFNMYEETVRVPLAVSHPAALGPKGKRVDDFVTSHVDLLPTLLGLAGLDPAGLAEQLRSTHSEVHPLVGRDLSPFVRGEAIPAESSAVYFATEDRILEGDLQISAIVQSLPPLRHVVAGAYDSVRGCPSSIEGVVVRLVDGDGNGRTWKLVRYFDDPDLWSEPGRCDSYRYQAGARAGELEQRTAPYPDEWELYDLANDPAELTNLAAATDHAAIFTHFKGVLTDERTRKRLARNDARPYAKVDPLPKPEQPWLDLTTIPGLVPLLDHLVTAEKDGDVD